MVAVAERGLWLPDAADRADLTTFAVRARRLDEAAVLRLRVRTEDTLTAWVATGFDVLAGREPFFRASATRPRSAPGCR